MEKVFYSLHFNRNITISISVYDVDFIFSTLEDDFSFYDFPLFEFKSKYIKLLQDKAWFTKEMADFITQNIQP